MDKIVKNKCSVQRTSFYKKGPCDAQEWKDGLCWRHHPNQRLVTLRRQLVQHQKKIDQILILISDYEKLRIQNSDWPTPQSVGPSEVKIKPDQATDFSVSGLKGFNK